MATTNESISTSTGFTTCTSSTTIMSVIFMALTILISLIKFRQSAPIKAKNHPLPPGPSPWPIIGNVPEFLKNKPTFRWLHLLMKNLNTEIACIRLGSVHVITVTCPKIALEILKKQDAIFASRPISMSSGTFSGGYLTTAFSPNGEQWKKMRKILTSEIVSPLRLKFVHDKRVEEADNLVKYVYNQCKGSNNVNVRLATRHFCGNVIRKMMFNKRYFGKGMPDGGPGVEEIEHVEAVFLALKYTWSFCISDYFPSLVGLDLDGQEKNVLEANSKIKKYHDPLIHERIQQWRHDPNKSQRGEEPQDLLDVLICLKDDNGNPLLAPAEIKAQTLEIVMATVDNPSNAVEWALAEMINKPEMLQKATEELDRVVGKHRLVQEYDIPHLNYVKACVREAFRLHPIVPFNLPHMAMSDTTVAGYFIPKGSHVLLSRQGLGTNSKVWKDPLKFKPERHLDGTQVVLTEHDLRFISFSTGRRGCIAASLGTLMTVMLLARLLQGFDWSPPPHASAIDLAESINDLFLEKPLIANAMPRLPLHLYPIT